MCPSSHITYDAHAQNVYTYTVHICVYSFHPLFSTPFFPPRIVHVVLSVLLPCSTSSLQCWCGNVPWRQWRPGSRWRETWSLVPSFLLWCSATSLQTPSRSAVRVGGQQWGASSAGEVSIGEGKGQRLAVRDQSMTLCIHYCEDLYWLEPLVMSCTGVYMHIGVIFKVSPCYFLTPKVYWEKYYVISTLTGIFAPKVLVRKMIVNIYIYVLALLQLTIALAWCKHRHNHTYSTAHRQLNARTRVARVSHACRTHVTRVCLHYAPRM